MDIDHLRSWIGREQQKSDTITPRLTESYCALFDVGADPRPGGLAPAGIHWCLAPDMAPMQSLGPDGHPERGGFLPPVPLPRRMWAAGNLIYSDDLRIGDEVVKHSRIEDVSVKNGRTGTLIFVTVGRRYFTARGLALTERQDIVYRKQQSPGAGNATAPVPEVPSQADRTETIDASSTLLFRYSAITFNGHRIHYDVDYATRQEGYPGLVFHGPLQASCLLRLASACANDRLPQEFSFRCVRPLFAGGKIVANAKMGKGAVEVWITDQAGIPTMTARATMT